MSGAHHLHQEMLFLQVFIPAELAPEEPILAAGMVIMSSDRLFDAQVIDEVRPIEDMCTGWCCVSSVFHITSFPKSLHPLLNFPENKENQSNDEFP